MLALRASEGHELPREALHDPSFLASFPGIKMKGTRCEPGDRRTNLLTDCLLRLRVTERSNPRAA